MSAPRRAAATACAALALWAAAVACAGDAPLERRSGLGGVILQREGGPARVVRERAAEVRRVPLDVSGARRVRVEDVDGDVRVTATRHGQAELRAHLRTVAADRTRAGKLLESIAIETEREGDTLTVRVRLPDRDKAYATNSSYELSVPSDLRVKVASDSGDVDVEGAFPGVSVETTFGHASIRGARGPVNGRSASGQILLEDVQGESVHAASEHGDLVLRDVRARAVEAQSRSGNVRLERVQAELALAATRYGMVDASALDGSARLSTLDGQLSYDARRPGVRSALRLGNGEARCAGGEGLLVIETQAGRIGIDGFTGTVQADSHHGSVELDGVFEGVRAQSGSGRLEVRAQPGSAASQDWRLRADFGNVVVALPASFACRLEAVTTKGTIRSEFPVEVEAEQDEAGLAGLLNGGGRSVSLRSENGRIEIQRR